MASIFYTSGFHVVGDPWGGMVFTFVAPVPKPGPAQDGRNHSRDLCSHRKRSSVELG